MKHYVVRCKRQIVGFGGRRYVPGQLVAADGSPVLQLERAQIHSNEPGNEFPFDEAMTVGFGKMRDYFEPMQINLGATL